MIFIKSNIFWGVLLNLFTASAFAEDRSFMTDEEIDSRYESPSILKELGSAAQRASLAERVERMRSAGDLAEKERVLLLATTLKAASSRSLYQIPERLAVIDKARAELLAIPGHAKYLVDAIEESRASPGRHERRAYYFIKLSLIPSAESVVALGNYLYDDRDDPIKDGVGVDDTYANSALAIINLVEMGLRDHPEVLENRSIRESVPMWREWFDSIKRGERTFSFEGGNVHYRLLPNGTIQILSHGDPGAATHTRPLRRPDRSALALASAPKEPSSEPHVWIITALLALLVGVGLCRLKSA